MRKLILHLLCLFLVVGTASGARGELVFHLGFAQDGVFEDSWRLRPGEGVKVDIYVSNVPEPGLRAMGFKMVYDSGKLEVVEDGTEVDENTWPVPFLDLSTAGEIDIAGTHVEKEGFSGDGIKLGSVRFKCIGTGLNELRLYDRGETVDGFVLTDGTVLDGDIADGVFLGRILPVLNPGVLMLLLSD